jgi:hypothetical protein
VGTVKSDGPAKKGRTAFSSEKPVFHRLADSPGGGAMGNEVGDYSR